MTDGGDSCLRFTLGLTEFCADATNTSIWQNSKLTGLLVTSMFLIDASKFGWGHEARQAFTWHRTLSLGFATFALFVCSLIDKPCNGVTYHVYKFTSNIDTFLPPMTTATTAASAAAAATTVTTTPTNNNQQHHVPTRNVIITYIFQQLNNNI